MQDWRSVYTKFFVILLECALVYAFPKNPRPLGVLNFIEIHSKNLQKTFAFRNLNPYLVFPKHCNFVHLKNSSVIQENWREEDCLNQRYTLV